MRFTIKAKLASTFGVIIALSMVAGGVAYYELSDVAHAEAEIVDQGKRISRIAQLQHELQAQIRAEKVLLLSSTDKDIEAQALEIVARRQHVAKLAGEIQAAASEQGRRLIETANARAKTLNDLQDETIRSARLNSGNQAMAIWRSDAPAIVAGQSKAFDAVLAELDKVPGSMERTAAARLVMAARFEAARSLRMIVETFSAGSMAELDSRGRVAVAEIAAGKHALGAALAALKLLDIPSSGLDTATEQLYGLGTRLLDIASQGGTVKAIEISRGEGQKALTETIAAFDAYGALAETQMSEIGAKALEMRLSPRCSWSPSCSPRC